ncbi:SLC13 family permease [Thermotoga sp. 38H-to]|nr:SLC13 family permease [Thermotoga sp. 38H-to]
MIPAIVLIVVFALISVRKFGKVKIQMWQIMLLGALCVVLTGQISISSALKSINLEVMLFLFSMFIIGTALEESGYLHHLSYIIFRRTRNKTELIFSIVFVFGILSAFLMNDTTAIIGTPVVLHLARRNNIKPSILLITLAFSVTVGSVMSPLGNPQNFIIATAGVIKNPFLDFFRYLALPTVLNLLVVFFMVRIFYRKHFVNETINHIKDSIEDVELAKISKISIVLLFSLIILKIILAFLKSSLNIELVHITLLSALPILIFSKKRNEIIKKIDWHTLIFFASMFVLMQSVWETGIFQSIFERLNFDVLSVSAILLVSVIMSQFISNVPMVTLYLPILLEAGAGVKELVTLAAGSTVAGNLFILGAASNVIIIQSAEKRTGDTITFWEFTKIGLPLTVVNILIYWFF